VPSDRVSLSSKLISWDGRVIHNCREVSIWPPSWPVSGSGARGLEDTDRSDRISLLLEPVSSAGKQALAPRCRRSLGASSKVLLQISHFVARSGIANALCSTSDSAFVNIWRFRVNFRPNERVQPSTGHE